MLTLTTDLSTLSEQELYALQGLIVEFRKIAMGNDFPASSELGKFMQATNEVLAETPAAVGRIDPASPGVKHVQRPEPTEPDSGMTTFADGTTAHAVDMGIAAPPPPPVIHRDDAPDVGLDASSIGFGAPPAPAPAAPKVFREGKEISPAESFQNGQAPSVPVPPPAPSTATAAAPPSPTNALDSRGLPWDPRIHSSTKALIGSGQWRQKRGVDPELVKQVETEQRALIAIPAPAAAAAPGAAPSSTVLPPPVPPVAGDPTFANAVGEITQWISEGKLANTDVADAVRQVTGGVTETLPALMAQPHLVKQVHETLRGKVAW